jgi:hypothetical protein
MFCYFILCCLNNTAKFVIANIFQQEQRSDNLTKFAKCKVQFVFATGIDSLRGMVESKSH